MNMSNQSLNISSMNPVSSIIMDQKGQIQHLLAKIKLLKQQQVDNEMTQTELVLEFEQMQCAARDTQKQIDRVNTIKGNLITQIDDENLDLMQQITDLQEEQLQKQGEVNSLRAQVYKNQQTVGEEEQMYEDSQLRIQQLGRDFEALKTEMELFKA